MKNENNTYNIVQYESKPIHNSRPENLNTIASFFGLTPPNLDNARILELGCAGGGNLIPFAMRYPKSQCLGIDLSSAQIDYAKKQAKILKVDNIDFSCLSITDIDESYGKFDYIICHGVFSWVPDFVREAILRVSSKNLSLNGIAYISYNTLPGWSVVDTIRQMMLYHSRKETGAEDILKKARGIVDFIKNNLPFDEDKYQEVLKAELEKIQGYSDHYIFHEHLEETNKQYYFHEFIDEASKHGLKYVGGSELFTMFRGSKAENILDELGVDGNIEEIEQYLDFLYNRRFRGSLLCKNNLNVHRKLPDERFKSFYFETKFEPSIPLSKVDIENSEEEIKFYYDADKDMEFTRADPISRALFYFFADHWNHLVSFEEIMQGICDILPKSYENIESKILFEIKHLIKLGYLNISSVAPSYTNILLDKPKISILARHQASENNKWVTNEMHRIIYIDDIETYLYRYLDGNHSYEDLIDKMLMHADNGDLKIDGDRKFVRSEVETAVKKSIDLLKYRSLLCF